MSGGASGTTQFLYDGDALVAEYNGSNTLLRRYIHGPGVDEPLIWYEGSGLTTRQLLRADHQGSIVVITDSAGNSIGINTYDEYGIPAQSNLGRFAYTGQIILPDLKFYHYKARIYSPTLGRFLQTDPIGYDDQINLYAYVGNDPMNGRDPTGEVGVGGAILGAVADVAIQRATGTEWEDIDLGDVAVAAAAGATGLGAVTQAGKAYKAYKAYKATQKGTKAAKRYTQNKAREGSQRKLNNAEFREGKAKEQSKAAAKDAAKAAGKAVGAVAGAKAAKEASPEVTPKDLKERNERQ